MMKRSKGKFGGNLGKTTGWIHRSNLKKKISNKNLEKKGVNQMHFKFI